MGHFGGGKHKDKKNVVVIYVEKIKEIFVSPKNPTPKKKENNEDEFNLEFVSRIFACFFIITIIYSVIMIIKECFFIV